ncbi:Patatin-like protein 2 [Hibiscus syriacus]|uniref:Patatin-like protein 2 n=1 Tax=Hibiscus syriacus TaxID=106335 RepID=A0A6A2WRF8_HIBSY|nr:Patatin-like protein 2 [Hibiscus syriacus]
MDQVYDPTATTYLPAHQLKTRDSTGGVKEFHLIDGGVAENNSTLVAMNEVAKAISSEGGDLDYARVWVLSLGTGSQKWEEKYEADKAAKWGVLGWLNPDDSTPLMDVFMQASTDMVDFHLATVFQLLHCEDHISSKENLEDLIMLGEELLKKPVSKVSLETGKFEPANQGTNEGALIRLAEVLSKEKRLRGIRSSHENFKEEDA